MNYEQNIKAIKKKESIMITEQQLDFILVKQKDTIISLINSKCFAEAETALLVVEELWMECSYGYKINEIRSRIEQEQGLEV